MRMTRARIAELAAAAIELDLGRGTVSNVVFDARIPDKSTGDRRQVDVAVYHLASGREYLRIVEVQRRVRKMGSGFVDEMLGKMRSLGAHRATLVSTAGFTGPALQRIRNDKNRFDAMVLQEDDGSDWPPTFERARFPLQVGNQVRHVKLDPYRYVNAVSNSIQYFILIGAFDTTGMHPADSNQGFAGAAAWVKRPTARPTENNDEWASLYLLGGVSGRPVRDLWANLTVTKKDGSTEILRLRPRVLPSSSPR